MAGLRGAGKIYFNVYDNGVYGGYLDLANIASFTISNTGSDTQTLKSTAPSNYGAVIGSSITPGDDTIKIALNVPNRKNLLLMTLGTDATVAVNSGAAVNESVTVSAKGTFVALANQKILTSPSPVVTNTAGTVTYVENTDYAVDYDNGLIEIKTAGAIPAGQIYVDYSYAARSGYSIQARTKTSFIGKLMFIGKNLDNDEMIRVTADSVELTPDGDFSLISADNAFLEFSMTGTLKVPEGATSPYTLSILS